MRPHLAGIGANLRDDDSLAYIPFKNPMMDADNLAPLPWVKLSRPSNINTVPLDHVLRLVTVAFAVVAVTRPEARRLNADPGRRVRHCRLVDTLGHIASWKPRPKPEQPLISQ